MRFSRWSWGAGLMAAVLGSQPRQASSTVVCLVTTATSSADPTEWSIRNDETRRGCNPDRSDCDDDDDSWPRCLDCYEYHTVQDTNDYTAYTYVTLQSDSCTDDAAALTLWSGTGEAFRCSHEAVCDPATQPEHPDTDISICSGHQSGQLLAPAAMSCEAAAEGLDRQARARPDAAEVGADRLDFYCDGYLPLLQLRDCTARVAFLNEILQSVSAPPDPGSNDDMGNDVAGLTGSPSFGPTAPPTATPRDVPAELDTVRAELATLQAETIALRNRSSEEATALRAELVAVQAQTALATERHEQAMAQVAETIALQNRSFEEATALRAELVAVQAQTALATERYEQATAQVATLRAQVTVLIDAAAATTSSAGPGEGTADNAGGSGGDAAIALALIAVLLAIATAALLVHKHRKMTNALQAQLDLQMTRGQQSLGMVDNPMYTHRRDADRNGNQDGYLAVGTDQHCLALHPGGGTVYESVDCGGSGNDMYQTPAAYGVLADRGSSGARVITLQGTGAYNRLGEA